MGFFVNKSEQIYKPERELFVFLTNNHKNSHIVYPQSIGMM